MNDDGAAFGKLMPLVAAALVLAAGMGFLTGTNPFVRPRASPVRGATLAVAERAPSYAELREGRRGPNAGMYVGAVDALRGPLPGVLDPVTQTEEERAQVVARRATRRAYDGAPPTIPHAIDQGGIPDCLGCHAAGARIADKTAPRMSHERYDACTQCHVVANDPRAGRETPPPRENFFVGLAPAPRGERAWPGAPPTIPHRTLMRGECASCHGTTGVSGMRSTHPYRQSCTQCHAPSAALDQRPKVEAP